MDFFNDLALALFMFRRDATNKKLALSFYDLALCTNFFNGAPYFHDI